MVSIASPANRIYLILGATADRDTALEDDRIDPDFCVCRPVLTLSYRPQNRKTFFASLPPTPVALVSSLAPGTVHNVLGHAVSVDLEKWTRTGHERRVVVYDLQTNRTRMSSAFGGRFGTVNDLNQQVVLDVGRKTPLLQYHRLLQPKIGRHRSVLLLLYYTKLQNKRP